MLLNELIKPAANSKETISEVAPAVGAVAKGLGKVGLGVGAVVGGSELVNKLTDNPGEHGSLKDGKNRQIFSYDQKGKLRDYPELKNWWMNLDRADQISKETKKKINNFKYDDDQMYGRTPDRKTDNIIGSWKSNPFRMGDQSGKGSGSNYYKANAFVPPPLVPPGPAPAPSVIPAYTSQMAGGYVNVPAAAPVSDEVPEPVTVHDTAKVHQDQPAVGKIPANAHDTGKVHQGQPAIAPVPDPVPRPEGIHPEITAQQAIIIQKEKDKTAAEAYKALMQYYKDEEAARRKANEIAAIHAAKLEKQARQNEIADARLIELARKLAISNALANLNNQRFDDDPAGEDPPAQIGDNLPSPTPGLTPGRTDQQVPDAVTQSGVIDPLTPGRTDQQVPDAVTQSGVIDPLTPGREDPPEQIGGGELIVDPEARKEQAQQIAYENAYQLMIDSGMEKEMADRYAQLFVLQQHASHEFGNLEKLSDDEWQKQKEMIAQAAASDANLIRKGERYAAAELARIEAIPSVDDGNTFADFPPDADDEPVGGTDADDEPVGGRTDPEGGPIPVDEPIAPLENRRRADAIRELMQQGIPRDLATKLADQAIADGVETEAFIEQQIEDYEEMFKLSQNAGVNPLQTKKEFMADIEAKLKEAYGPVRDPDGNRVPNGETISAHIGVDDDGNIVQILPTDNQFVKEEIDKEIAKVQAAQAAGLKTTGELSVEQTSDLVSNIGLVAVALLAAAGIITIGWAVVGTGVLTGVAAGIAKALTATAVLLGLSRTAMGDTGEGDSPQADTPTDHGYTPEMNALIDKIQAIGEQIRLEPDPSKQLELMKERRRLLREFKKLERERSE
jgi:hypothetical protein